MSLTALALVLLAAWIVLVFIAHFVAGWVLLVIGLIVLGMALSHRRTVVRRGPPSGPVV